MDNRFLAIVAVIIVGFVGVIVFNKQNASAPSGSNSKAQPTNHVKGENAKKVTVVEYGDFQCPVCATYEPVLREVFEKYKNDIQFQYRNFPLQQIHQNALAGARAAEAASLQGKFWEMHDQLYDNQQTWSVSSTPNTYFDSYAKALGLDEAKFKKDFASSAVNDTINADIAEGEKLKVNGTPGIVIDGKLHENGDFTDDKNAPSVEKFSKIIDAAIAAKK